MRDLLVDIINHRSAITFSLILVGVMLFVSLRDGLDIVDVLILGGMIIVGYILWRVRVPSSTKGIDSLEAFQKTLDNGNRPTLVQLYSRYCSGCLVVKPIVDQLEAEAGERLQLIRLDIDQEPGKSLLKQYGVLFTPTFFYFDKNGNKIRESTFVLDRPRILYELERA
jgi:thioredoxin 1